MVDRGVSGGQRGPAGSPKAAARTFRPQAEAERAWERLMAATANLGTAHAEFKIALTAYQLAKEEPANGSFNAA